MARTSISLGFTALRGRLATLAAASLAVLSLALAGCLSNDHPAESGGSMTVDIRGLKQQLGSGFHTQGAGQGGSDATTEVKSLIIGAVVITFTDSPLSETTQINSDLEDKFSSDVINSINFFSIVDLPSSEDFVEFKVPPPGADHWQVAAVGTKKQIVTFEDLSDNNVAIYYGFDPNFHTTSGNSTPAVSITMNRACFIDEPPLGCAAYGDGAKPVLTPTVKVLDILDNGTSIGASVGGQSFPLDVTAATLSTMKTAMDAFNPAVGHKITVVATHPDAPGQSSCSALTHANYGSQTDAVTDLCIGEFVSQF